MLVVLLGELRVVTKSPGASPSVAYASATPAATVVAAPAATVVATQAEGASPDQTPTSTAIPQPTPKPAPAPQPQDALRALVATTFSGESRENKPRLRAVDVVQQINGGWGVFVQFNADNDLTNGLTKGGIEDQMLDGYKAIYTSGLDVRSASMGAWLSVIDGNGNKSEAMVYKTILEGGTAKKVNWANADTLKWPEIWETTILYPFLAK